MQLARLTPFALGAAAGAVYASRACPTVSTFGDSAELGAAAALWGVPHPPGYPLLTLIGHCFASIPVGDIAWRIHLTSVVFHTATLLVVACAVLSWTRSVLAACVATGTLALSRTFFLGSLYYESFPLNDLFMALCLWLAGRAEQRGHDQPFQGSSLRCLAAVFGLGVGHHQMLLLAAPGLLVLLWPLLKRMKGLRSWLGLVGAALLPLLGSVALLWLAARREVETSWAELSSFSTLMAHVTRQEYGGLLSASSRHWPFWILRRQSAYWELLSGSVGIIGVMFGLLAGIAVAVRHRSRLAVALCITFVLSGPVFFGINRVELTFEEHLAWCERFASMSHVPLVMLLGLGVEAAMQWTRDRSSLGSIGLFAIPPFVWLQPALTATRLDLSDDYLGLSFARDLIERTPDRSVLFLRGALHRVLGEHQCAVYRACGERVVVSAYSSWRYERIRNLHPELRLPPWSAQFRSGLRPIIDAVLPERDVFISPELAARYPDLLSRYRFEPDLLLFRLAPIETDLSRSLRASAVSALAGGCATCQRLPEWLPRPTMHAQEFRQYHVGFRNLAARYRSVIGWDPILDQLEQHAQGFDLSAWSSAATQGKELDRMRLAPSAQP